jgi:hypothetical protein
MDWQGEKSNEEDSLQGNRGAGCELSSSPCGTSGVETLLSLLVNDRGQLGYLPLSSSRKEDTLSMPALIGHRTELFASAWFELMDIRKASVWIFLAPEL